MTENFIMEQFHWTEKQLYEENSFDRVLQISAGNEIRGIVEKVNGQNPSSSGAGGGRSERRQTETFGASSDR